MKTAEDEFYIKVGRALSAGFPEVAERLLHDKQHPEHAWMDCPEQERWAAIAATVSEWASR